MMKICLLIVSTGLLCANAYGDQNMNYKITCTQESEGFKAVIVNSNSDSILGTKIAINPPTLFLYFNGKLEGRIALDSAVLSNSQLKFSTQNQNASGKVQIQDLSTPPTPGVYLGTANIYAHASYFLMNAKSIPCDVMIDQ